MEATGRKPVKRTAKRAAKRTAKKPVRQRRWSRRVERRKAEPYRSAMSMLTFYINRAGKQLSKAEKARLEDAKDELRALYGRPQKG